MSIVRYDLRCEIIRAKAKGAPAKLLVGFFAAVKMKIILKIFGDHFGDQNHYF